MAATQDSSQYIRKISFCFKCSYEYFRCEDYAISLLEQCENLQEVETFLQTTNSGIKVVFYKCNYTNWCYIGLLPLGLSDLINHHTV